MEFEAKISKATLAQASVYDLKCRHLFRDEKYTAAQADVVRNDVANGFRLAGSRRAFEDEVPLLTRRMNRNDLGAVCIERRHEFRGIDRRIDLPWVQEARAAFI